MFVGSCNRTLLRKRSVCTHCCNCCVKKTPPIYFSRCQFFGAASVSQKRNRTRALAEVSYLEAQRSLLWLKPPPIEVFAFEAWRGLEAKEVSPLPTLRPLTPSLTLSLFLSLCVCVSRCAALDATHSRVETHAAQGTRGMRTKGSFALFGSVHKRGRYIIPARPLVKKTRALVQPRILSRNYGRSAFFARVCCSRVNDSSCEPEAEHSKP